MGSDTKPYDPKDLQAQCVESQEYTFGIDNTGTKTEVFAQICIVNSDGSTIEFQQTATSAPKAWLDQMIEWGQKISDGAGSSGLQWFAETRVVRQKSPDDISGGSGLSGPSSVSISHQLAADGMVAKYVNIQICAGQPTPVSAIWKELDGDGGNVVREVNLLTAGPYLGEIKKFWLCAVCGSEPVFYAADGVTIVDEPDCYEPCGTLALLDATDGPDCQFVYDSGCDSENQTNVTRRTVFCPGENPSFEYFEEDTDDPDGGLIGYQLIGEFVDCVSGEPVPNPTAEPETLSNHLIEGCILSDPNDPNSEKVSAFTIVDQTGVALFPPKPLTDLGFVECC